MFNRFKLSIISNQLVSWMTGSIFVFQLEKLINWSKITSSNEMVSDWKLCLVIWSRPVWLRLNSLTPRGHTCPLWLKFQFYFKKRSPKNFPWASRLWVATMSQAMFRKTTKKIIGTKNTMTIINQTLILFIELEYVSYIKYYIKNKA